ncbi:TIGR03089 family protein [Hoyosella rhizosphaerae]|uniref:TIGR03089 family protein n=1 Tax=Hoyosella rhizosphaerae TaxID=1755582 RepID=A0A916UA54_9ACTN|nr:TIGR03089 family protein [Hoyosella rhizosphaerae]GGC66197.1 TIGR03089 family protein [Hoyosella rhizosphaerae]
MTLTDTLLRPILASDGARPLITYYDNSTGERIELSGITFTNWAAKIANMIRDEFGLAPGDRVAILLPAHWQTAAVVLGAWWAGCEVVLGQADGADLAFTDEKNLAEASPANDIAALSLHPFGRGILNLPPGVTDFATTVPGHGDQFQPDADENGPVLDGLLATEVLELASATEGNWNSQTRVLSTKPWNDARELITGLVSVLSMGGSLVQVTGADDSGLDRIAVTEKVTDRI